MNTKQQRSPSGLLCADLTVPLVYNQAAVCTHTVKQEYFRLLRTAIMPNLRNACACVDDSNRVHAQIKDMQTSCNAMQCKRKCLFTLAQGSLTTLDV